MPSRRAEAGAGFSLIEVLASLAIVAALASAVLPLTRDLLARWSAGPERADLADHWMRGLLRLSEDAGEALPMPAQVDAARDGFALAPKCLRFTRRAMLAETPGLRRVTYRIVDDAGAHRLLRQSAPLLLSQDAGSETAPATLVLSGAWPMHFEALGAEPRGPSAPGEGLPPAIALIFGADKEGAAPAPLIIPLTARSPVEQQAQKAPAARASVENGC